MLWHQREHVHASARTCHPSLYIAWTIARVVGVGSLTVGSVGAFWVCLAYGLTFACPLLAIGGAIKVLIDIEENTRATRELLRAQARK